MSKFDRQKLSERDNGDWEATDAGARSLIAEAFSKIVEAQDVLRPAEMQFALYMLDAVKLALAKEATMLIGVSADLADNEREMIRWFRSTDDEETELPAGLREVN